MRSLTDRLGPGKAPAAGWGSALRLQALGPVSAVAVRAGFFTVESYMPGRMVQLNAGLLQRQSGKCQHARLRITDHGRCLVGLLLEYPGNTQAARKVLRVEAMG